MLIIDDGPQVPECKGEESIRLGYEITIDKHNMTERNTLARFMMRPSSLDTYGKCSDLRR